MGKLYHEEDFKMDNYEEFYESHYFYALKDDDAINAHRVLPRVAWALDVAREVQAKKVLDLGCLEGYAALTLSNKLGCVQEVVGVDLSQDGIDSANRRAKENNINGTFVKDTIENFLENCKEKFDLILMFEVIEHVKDPELIIKLIDGVLAEGGTVLVSTPAFESPTFGKDDEQNKCHIRLYTMKDEDYEEKNKYGTLRKATSMPKQFGKDRIISMEVYSELINMRYS